MKGKRKIAMILSFCLGAAMFVGTAFADVSSKGGYSQFKDAIKDTVAACIDGYDSYTVEVAASLKLDEELLISNRMMSKNDNVGGKTEDVDFIDFGKGEEQRTYSYTDLSTSINRYAYAQDVYYVHEFEGERSHITTHRADPFKEEGAEDIEKIFDAMIGNLKNHVVVESNGDGTKKFSGSISDTQIPPIINAVASFAFKQSIGSYDTGVVSLALKESDTTGLDDAYEGDDYWMKKILQLKRDVFIRTVSGRANVNEDGIIENLFASVILSGKDEDGEESVLVFEMVIKLYNINSTVITRPDLTGEKVETYTPYKYTDKLKKSKLVGSWKHDIIIEKNDELIKIGERIIEITDVGEQSVIGKFKEVIKDEYTEYEILKGELDFKVDASDYNFYFEGTDDAGEVITGYMWFEDSYIELTLDMKDMNLYERGYNRQYNRVFAD